MSLEREIRGRAALEQASRERTRKQTDGKKMRIGFVVAGGFILLWGVRQLYSVAIQSIFLSRMDLVQLFGGIAFCISGYQIMTGKEKPKKKKEKAEKPKASPRKSRQPAEEEQWKKSISKAVEPKNSGFSFRADHHQHIQITGISTEKRLAQLDTLMGAGLYTHEEYKKEKDRILSGK